MASNVQFIAPSVTKLVGFEPAFQINGYALLVLKTTRQPMIFMMVPQVRS